MIRFIRKFFKMEVPPKIESPRKIFVSYFWTRFDGNGYANGSYTIAGVDRKVSQKTLENIRDMILKESKFEKVVILNWKEV
jgi:hypothetical protein